jgi:carbon monoxide dehydrogenase subunit G
MELHNTFTVPVTVDEAWRVMLDVQQLAPCMPGASVDEVQGDDVLGRVKVKLGPISVTYRGKLTFVERDEEKHRVVLDAAAHELKGSGTASARITAGMESVEAGTEVTVTTDLSITGKPAQFGRSVMNDVSERIIGQFAQNLARELEGGRRPPQPLSPLSSAPTSTATVAREPSEALDLLGAAGAPVIKRVVPIVVAVAALVVAVLVGRRSTTGRRGR